MLRERKSVFELALLSLWLFAGSPAPLYAQRPDSDNFGALRYRHIGPVGNRVSAETVRASWNVAASASATASLACVPTWHEDFRNDVARIDVPTLVIHGDADRIVPSKASGEKTAKLVKGARLVTIKDGPHAVNWTHADEVNVELVKFLGKSAAKRAASTS